MLRVGRCRIRKNLRCALCRTIHPLTDAWSLTVVFVHGLWLLPSSWKRWAALFEEAGYAAVTPGWPDDPETVDEANAHPEVLAHKSVGQVADHYADILGKLQRKPALIGHSFAGLVVQILAGRGLGAVTVAIDPAPSAVCYRYQSRH